MNSVPILTWCEIKLCWNVGESQGMFGIKKKKGPWLRQNDTNYRKGMANFTEQQTSLTPI